MRNSVWFRSRCLPGNQQSLLPNWKKIQTVYDDGLTHSYSGYINSIHNIKY